MMMMMSSLLLALNRAIDTYIDGSLGNNVRKAMADDDDESFPLALREVLDIHRWVFRTWLRSKPNMAYIANYAMTLLNLVVMGLLQKFFLSIFSVL